MSMVRAFKYAGVITGFAIAFLFGLSGLLSESFLGLLTRVHANLYSDCGSFCSIPTPTGWAISILSYGLLGLLASYMVWKIYVRIGKYRGGFIFLSVIATIVLITGVTFAFDLLHNSIDFDFRLPASTRCIGVSTYHRSTSNWDLSAEAGCVAQRAYDAQDPSLCFSKFGTLFRDRCLRRVDKDITSELCATINNDHFKDSCNAFVIIND